MPGLRRLVPVALGCCAGGMRYPDGGGLTAGERAQAPQVLPSSAWATAGVVGSASDGGGGPACGYAAGCGRSSMPCGDEGAQAGQRNRILGTLTVFPQPGCGIRAC